MASKINNLKSVFDFEINLDKMLYRPRINLLFEKGLSYPLTLVCAPAGYGKTTAAMQFAKKSNIDVIYMSLSELDRKPQYFWTHLSRLFEQLWPDIGEPMTQIGFPFSAAQFEQQVENAGQFVTHQREFALIVDDYHILQNSMIDELLNKVARQRLKKAHIYILSRTSLQDIMLELKIKGIAMEITKEDLHFSSNEIREYYGMYDIDIEETGAKCIEGFTEGWASAVFLSSLYIKKAKDRELNFQAATLDIDNLIQNTIFNDYSEDTREFLLKLSILERFDIELCNYLTDMNNARKLLSEALNHNSLIKISEDRNYYYMHSLLRDFLRQKLYTEEPELIKGLYNRAGEYFSLKDDVITALVYFDLADNYERIAELMLKNKFSGTYSLTQIEMVVTYIRKLPPEYYMKNPMLLVILALLLTRSGHMQGSSKIIHRVEALCQDPRMPENIKNKLLGESAVVKSIMAFNNVPEMHKFHMEACRLLPDGSELMSRNISFTFGSPSILYLYYNRPGNLDRLVEDFLDKIHWWDSINPCSYGSEFLIKAEAEHERCNYQKAEEYAYRAIYKAEMKENNSTIIASKFLLIKLCLAEGNYGKAAVLLQEMKRIVRFRDALIYSTILDLCIGFFNIYTGDFKKIPRWLYKGEIDKSSVFMAAYGFEYLIYSSILLREGDFLRLESIIQPMLEAFTPYNYQYGIIRANILKGITDFYLYGMEKALYSLNAAYGTAIQDNLIMPFLENVEFLVPIFNQIIRQYNNFQVEFPIDWLKSIIKRQKEYQKALYKFKAGYRSNNPEEIKDIPKLTRREGEILALIARGYSGEDIARELFVTINNVKAITSKVYRKIGVRSRAEAVKFVHDNKLFEGNI